MKLCDEPHPEREGVTCDKSAPCWGYHANAKDGAVWPGTALPPTETASRTRASVKGQLALMASRAR